MPWPSPAAVLNPSAKQTGYGYNLHCTARALSYHQRLQHGIPRQNQPANPDFVCAKVIARLVDMVWVGAGAFRTRAGRSDRQGPSAGRVDCQRQHPLLFLPEHLVFTGRPEVQGTAASQSTAAKLQMNRGEALARADARGVPAMRDQATASKPAQLPDIEDTPPASTVDHDRTQGSST